MLPLSLYYATKTQSYSPTPSLCIGRQPLYIGQPCQHKPIHSPPRPVHRRIQKDSASTSPSPSLYPRQSNKLVQLQSKKNHSAISAKSHMNTLFCEDGPTAAAQFRVTNNIQSSSTTSGKARNEHPLNSITWLAGQVSSVRVQTKPLFARHSCKSIMAVLPGSTISTRRNYSSWSTFSFNSTTGS